jgi:hypothetical protein
MPEASANETPPVFSSWNGWYWLVMGVAAAQMIIYYLITRSFS